MSSEPTAVAAAVADMNNRLQQLKVPHRRPFLGTYMRTTEAVGNAISSSFFEDPEWVERWDVAFARL